MENITFNMAGIGIELRCADSSLLKHLGERYHSFLGDCESILSLEFIVEEALTEPSGPMPLIVQAEDGISLSGGHGVQWHVLADRSGGVLRVYRDPKTFDTGMRTLFSWLLPRCGGMLLHAAAVRSNGRGYVFYGQSSAGKSTIAGLSHTTGKAVFTDEIAAVRKVDGQYRVYGTPFHGDFIAPPFNEWCPLDLLIEPVKSSAISVEKKEAGETVVPLLKTMMNFETGRESNNRALDVVLDMVSSVSLARMAFTQTGDIWRVLDRYAANQHQPAGRVRTYRGTVPAITPDDRRLHRLNATASALWRFLEKGSSEKDALVGELLSRYEGPGETVRGDIDEFVIAAASAERVEKHA